MSRVSGNITDNEGQETPVSAPPAVMPPKAKRVRPMVRLSNKGKRAVHGPNGLEIAPKKSVTVELGAFQDLRLFAQRECLVVEHFEG